MSAEMMRKVVMLHDREHSNFDAVRRNGGLGEYLSVRSFTDLIDEENPHNAGLEEAAFREADYLLIQGRLLEPATQTALMTLNTVLLSSVCQTKVGIFTDDYQVHMLSFSETVGLLEEATGVGGVRV